MQNIIKIIFTLYLCFLTTLIEAQPPLKIQKVSHHCYVFTTYRALGTIKFPSNGMVARPVGVVSTHFHDDRTAGLHYYNELNIPTFSSSFTKKLCIEKGEKFAHNTFSADTTFNIGKMHVQTYYPGEGHSPDNIVIYVPEDKVLFGGCLVKSYEASSLGYLGDANTEAWPSTLQKVVAKFNNIAITIPGHQDWSQPHSIRKSLELLRIRPGKQ